MKTRVNPIRLAMAAAIGVIGLLVQQRAAIAHCDTLAGPVVVDARKALEKGDVKPVLKWVKKDHEQEIRDAFKKTLAVRSKGADAKELADMYFFETLVRVHREGEGAPYTGLKPAEEVEPGIAAADKSLETGSVVSLVKEVTETVAHGIRERFERAIEAKKHVNQSVESGREFVEAYVEFIHYVERLHDDATTSAGHHAAPAEHEGEHH